MGNNPLLLWKIKHLAVFFGLFEYKSEYDELIMD